MLKIRMWYVEFRALMISIAGVIKPSPMGQLEMERPPTLAHRSKLMLEPNISMLIRLAISPAQFRWLVN
ncbi:MAG: hypothetical protein IPK68_18605 [Bdellovibrionales bacterium]|nr:hypothetical protein [Bdellovibrionales bacterium]